MNQLHKTVNMLFVMELQKITEIQQVAMNILKLRIHNIMNVVLVQSINSK